MLITIKINLSKNFKKSNKYIMNLFKSFDVNKIRFADKLINGPISKNAKKIGNY